MTAPTKLREIQRPAKGLGIRRLVVGTDFSQDGNRAVRRAAALPLAPHATLLVAHVLSPGTRAAVASLARGAAEIELESLATRLRYALEARRRADVTVHTRVLSGPTWEILDRVAIAFGAELVVVGRRGQSRIRELVLGTTARRLLRAGRLPILMVGRRPVSVYQQAIVGIDLSPESLRAARMARQLVPFSATLIGVHTFEDPHRGLPPGLVPDRTVRTADMFRERGRLVRRALDTVGAGAKPWQVVVREGDPRQVLLEMVRPRPAVLLAVGSTGKTRLARTVLGSVAEGILDRSPCDVLVVRRRFRRAGGG
jgi:nucleotide-binding universal stress UspA family protein